MRFLSENFPHAGYSDLNVLRMYDEIRQLCSLTEVWKTEDASLAVYFAYTEHSELHLQNVRRNTTNAQTQKGETRHA